jgi:hypothetical protein
MVSGAVIVSDPNCRLTEVWDGKEEQVQGDVQEGDEGLVDEIPCGTRVH